MIKNTELRGDVMSSNKKAKYCILIFFVILFFGMLAPVSDNEDSTTREMTTSESSVDEVIADNQDNNQNSNISEDSTDEKNTESVSENTFGTDYELTTEDEYGVTTEDNTQDVNIENSAYVLSAEKEKKLDNIINDMTIEEKVGQLFFIKNDGRFNYSILDTYPVGGIILFSGDFVGETSESVKEQLADFQNNSDIPLLIGVDEEGGSVIRLSKYSNLVSTPYQSPKSLYAQGGYELIEMDTINKSQVLLSYGINVNFAPVCDLSFNSSDFMYNRAFGGSVDDTCAYVDLVVRTMRDNNLGAVLKHFPGYGSNGDTHQTIIRDSRSYTRFENNDFLPFKAGIDAGGQCVLVSHNIVECMDKNWPASLSPKVNEILREDFNFDGVVITDDLMMKGVSEYVSLEEAAVQAVVAGNDMILSTDYSVQYNAVVNAVRDGTISEDRIDTSVKRILRWKYSLGLLDDVL